MKKLILLLSVFNGFIFCALTKGERAELMSDDMQMIDLNNQIKSAPKKDLLELDMERIQLQREINSIL